MTGLDYMVFFFYCKSCVLGKHALEGFIRVHTHILLYTLASNTLMVELKVLVSTCETRVFKDFPNSRCVTP